VNLTTATSQLSDDGPHRGRTWALVDRKQWLVWKLEKDPKRPEKKKLLKVPYYVDGGRRYGEQGNERDRRRLAVHAAALKAAPAPASSSATAASASRSCPATG
jgi:hypothetical protein